MARIIRRTYPLELSIGLLLLIFVITFFLSAQIFVVTLNEMKSGTPVYLGMALVSVATIVVVLVLWEEFLFPIRIKPTESGVEFRNHRNKLKTQFLIYCAIPVIYFFVYVEYEVNLVRFIIWASISILVPVAGKLSSGINNYNDFLKLTNDTFEYKNNKQEGVFLMDEVNGITLVRDERNVLHKLIVTVKGEEVMIDIDEMELEAYYAAIDEFITTHYKDLIRVTSRV